MTGARRGFTLMELLVVMGLFSVTVIMATDIFLISNRAQRRVLAITTAQADLRYALEAIVREVRMGRIDYASYAGASGAVSVPTDRLIIKGPTGAEEQFYLETSPTVCPSGVAKCIAMTVNGSAPQALTSVGNDVDILAFYVSPQSDPFQADPSSGLYAANLQPTVTIVVQARTVGIGAADIQTVNAETTTASRIYER